MKKLIVSALIAAASVPAFAWGDREQGALAGIAGTLIFQHIMRGHGSVPVYPQQFPQQYPQQPQVITTPSYPPVIAYPQQRAPVCTWITEARVDAYNNIYYVPRYQCL